MGALLIKVNFGFLLIIETRKPAAPTPICHIESMLLERVLWPPIFIRRPFTSSHLSEFDYGPSRVCVRVWYLTACLRATARSTTHARQFSLLSLRALYVFLRVCRRGCPCLVRVCVGRGLFGFTRWVLGLVGDLMAGFGCRVTTSIYYQDGIYVTCYAMSAFLLVTVRVL